MTSKFMESRAGYEVRNIGTAELNHTTLDRQSVHCGNPRCHAQPINSVTWSGKRLEWESMRPEETYRLTAKTILEHRCRDPRKKNGISMLQAGNLL